MMQSTIRGRSKVNGPVIPTSTELGSGSPAIVEVITPVIAQEILKTNSRNRHINKPAVIRYAAEMAAGNWKLNGDTIKIGTDGAVIDGQHRLLACVKSGHSFETYVVRGLDQGVFDSVDIGKPRTPRDILTVIGVNNPSQVSHALRLLMYWQTGGGVLQRIDFSRVNYLPLLDQNPDVQLSAAFIADLQKRYGRLLLSDGVATFCHYQFSKVDPESARDFFTRLYSGEELSRDHPILILRTKFIQASVNRVRIDEINQVTLVVKAWNAFYRKLPMRHLRCARGERLPRIEGLAA